MSKFLSVVLAIALIVMCIFWYQSCSNGGKLTVLKAEKSELETNLNSDITQAKQDLAASEKARDALMKEKAALQEKADEFAKTNTGLSAEVKKSIEEMNWWFKQAEKLKGLLVAAEKAQQDLGDQMAILDGEKGKLQGEYDGLFAEKAALGEELADTKDLAEALVIADAEEARKAEQAIAALEERIRQAKQKIKLLEIELTGLKSRVLSVQEKAAKQKAAADSFKIYVVLTAVSPNLDLKSEIRALTAEILPKMYSVSDDELYKLVEPIMDKMPTQDSVKSVPLLHASWKRWKEARVLYSQLQRSESKSFSSKLDEAFANKAVVVR